MDKKVAVVLGLVVVVGVTALVLLNKGERGVRKHTEAYPFPELKVNPPKDPKARAAWVSPIRKNVDRIELTKKGKTLVIKRLAPGTKKMDVGQWEIVSPKKYPASASAIRGLFSKLERLEFWEVLTKSQGDFKDLGVDDASATRLRVFAGDRLLADMLVGKTITATVGSRKETYTAVRKFGTNVVWKLGGSARYIFGKPLEKWRDDSIVKKSRDDMALLAMLDKDTIIATSRNPDETDRTKKYANWKLVSARPEIRVLGQSDLGRVASTFSRLRAKDFADDAKPDQVGLDNPRRIVIAVYKKKSTKATKKTDDEAASKTGDKSAKKAHDATKTSADKAAKKTGEKAAKQTGDKAQAKSDQKTAAPPLPEADPSKLDPKLLALIKKVTGSESPELTQALRRLAGFAASPDYEMVVLLVGKDKPKDKATYVKRFDSPQVFLIRSYSTKTLTMPSVQFQDKTVLKLNPADITEITVRHEKGTVHLVKKGEDWKALSPKDLDKNLNRPMVKRVVDIFKGRFKAKSFAKETSPSKTGLNKPKGRVTIKTKTKTYEILVGKEAQRNQYYVQVKGHKDIFVMGSYPLFQIYKEPSRWQKPKGKRPPLRRP